MYFGSGEGGMGVEGVGWGGVEGRGMRCWGRGVKGYILWGRGVERGRGVEGYVAMGGVGVEGARDMVLGEGAWRDTWDVGRGEGCGDGGVERYVGWGWGVGGARDMALCVCVCVGVGGVLQRGLGYMHRAGSVCAFAVCVRVHVFVCSVRVCMRGRGERDTEREIKTGTRKL